ncbi:MAG: hypothetical protein D6775_15500 [Caldilineae bacterium]|nr:MAG: hypothetical protein D6775_15500 [Caldilineae bacterium]
MDILGLLTPQSSLLLLLGVAYGALFDLWRGESWKDLLLFVAASLVGMSLGQAAGRMLGLNLVTIGPTYLLESTISSWVMMFAVAWLKG